MTEPITEKQYTSGRKPRFGVKMKLYPLYLKPAQIEYVEEMGGKDYLREMIESARKRRKR